ncbi:TolB family protein [Streptomyces sp. R41]|uniref:TolB family protein n=1 Tax=Streptomyces sp. R41 TaxID=3238632 RepID=A0AB39RJK0_9ACTN
MSRKKTVLTGLLLSGVLGTMGALPAHAEPDPVPPATERISVTRDGQQLAGASYDPAMGEGRVVAFTTEGAGGPNDTNVYVNAAGGISWVSSNMQGASYDGSPCYSGRMVGFVSPYTKPGSPGPDGAPGVYIRNRAVGKLTGIGHYQGIRFTWMGQPMVDPTCQWITYAATLPATDADPHPRPRVYRFKFNGGDTALVSEPSGAAAGNPSINYDGRYVAFEQGGDIYVRDMDTGTLEKATVARHGHAADGRSSAPSISADGRRVAFDSYASNLARGDRNRDVNVFVRDLDAGTTTMVNGVRKKDRTAQASLSGNGTHVAYTSAGKSGKGSAPAVYLLELATGKTQLISVDRWGGRNDLPARKPSVNADGTVVAFESASPDLVEGDTNGVSDVFLRTVQ